MIRNNLAKLLAERSIRNTTAAMQTGISRNTITSTAQNDGKMIQLETINVLCQYLGITPDKFFSYVPYDIDFELETNSFSERKGKLAGHPVFDGLITKTQNGQHTSFDLTIILTGKEIALQHFNPLQEYEINVLLGTYEDPSMPFETTQEKAKREAFQAFWNEVPDGFKGDIQNTIVEKVTKAFWDEYTKIVDANMRSKFNYMVNPNWFIPARGFDENEDNKTINTKVKYENDDDFDLPF